MSDKSGVDETGAGASKVKSKASQFPCPACGADTKFQPGADALVCEHCGAKVKVERGATPIVEHPLAAGRVQAAKGLAAGLVPGAREVQCKTCGARTITTTQAGRCPFCDSTLVVEIATTEAAFLPESVLPFDIDKKAAQATWQTWLARRWFAPSDVKERAEKVGLDGCYLPYWTFDTCTVTNYCGERGDHYYVTEHYTDSAGKDQTREVRHTRWSNTKGTVTVAFDDVLVSASETLPRPLIQKLEPWDLHDLRPFDNMYLAGFIAERYQLELEPGFELAKARMQPDIRTKVNTEIGGDEQRISSMDVDYQRSTFKHVLLPLWISSYRYQEKVYRVVVNARSGDIVGERPWSKWKVFLFILMIIAMIVGTVMLVRHFRHEPVPAEVLPSTPTP